MEVKDVLAYLRFIYNPNDTDAFERIINTPRRGMGEVTLNKIEAQSRKSGWDVVRVLREGISGRGKGLSLQSKVKSNVREFLALYDTVQDMIKAKVKFSQLNLMLSYLRLTLQSFTGASVRHFEIYR